MHGGPDEEQHEKSSMRKHRSSQQYPTTPVS